MHIPVLLDEVVRFIRPKAGGIYVDATLGSGGHAEKILEESNPDGKLIGIEIDPEVLEIAKKKLKGYGNRCVFIENNYAELLSILENLNIENIDGIIFDLGVNIEHFERADRGFSFLKDGPLDMRLSPRIKVTAEKIVNEWKPDQLIKILYEFGEESRAKKIVKDLAAERRNRRISTTGELAELITKAVGGRKFWKIHPATKTFQALRIAVNSELKNIESTLPEAVDLLKPGGRICVISFHSLEDRIVKNIFRALSAPCVCPPEIGECRCGHVPKVKVITKKPVAPGTEELVSNIKARSAKLRVVEKI